MATLALIHANEGPLVAIHRIKNPALRVTSLPSGASLHVSVWQASGAVSLFVIEENGTHPLKAGDWVQVSCMNVRKHRTICEVVSKRVA